MTNKIQYLILLLIGVLLSACISGHQMGQVPSESEKAEDHRATEAYREKVESLKIDLAVLNRQADLLEAGRVAQTAIQYSAYLADRYELVRPAALHNVLVRIGLKGRGLCYHWTVDLMKQLDLLELQSYQLYWGVAHRGSELREHNSVVVAARGQRFEEGIVLDPWRNSGELYWTLVKNDHYPWQERPRNEW
jgi:hypothetical protein